MGQIELEGIVGPKGKKPSRFTTVEHEKLDSLNINSLERNPVNTYNYLTNALSIMKIPGRKGEGEDLLKEEGLTINMASIISRSILNSSVTILGVESLLKIVL